MKQHLQAGIIMGNTLAALGLKSLLETRLGIEGHLAESVDELQHPAADSSLACIFTDTATFAAHQAYFAPRRTRTIVVDDRTPLTADGTLPIIDATLDADRLARQITQLLQTSDQPTAESPLLSQREIDVLRLIANGKINKEIADCLGISINTVLTHRKNITTKLGIKSVSGLTFYALMNGIITP